MEEDTHLKTYPLLLGEIILKLESLQKDLPVEFDYGNYKPTGIASWRGSYYEMAIHYESCGTTCTDKPSETCTKDSFGDHDYNCKCDLKKYETHMEEPTVGELLEMLKLSIGKRFIGYKGGDFYFYENTPVWVSNYSVSSGFERDEDYTAIFDVIEENSTCIIVTGNYKLL